MVCSFPHYQRTALAPRYRRLFEVERAAPGYRIVRCRVSVPRTGALWRRALNYLSFLATGLLAILAAGRHDVVFACTPPPTVGVLAVVARWLWRRLHRQCAGHLPGCGGQARLAAPPLAGAQRILRCEQLPCIALRPRCA
ncbi:MAG: hypothetical protein U1E76_19930 [Planctomycetota bacterium]